MELNLVALRARRSGSSGPIHELLDGTFSVHKHRDSAAHFACECAGFVSECYPMAEARRPRGVRIGFLGGSVEARVEEIRAAGLGRGLRSPKSSWWGRRAVVEDPAGHTVELTERSK